MINVPKKALMANDDGGNQVAPEIGDEVDLGGVKAVVKSVDGDNYGLDITSVNGEACNYDEKPADDSMDSMRDNLMSGMADADKTATD